ncbi:MAG: hypothetical protein A2979_09365 [Deltaproteobacteria bacterium RIFCSPLOWO2_01_FULL_45_74]|nr:MAG: hypothetical protein A2712_03465 [Deltaproteobacteria bacterium RIFCSPHIGHO2_01_FULL_43_49]OGQ16250.1 MAG: hypothetical protein A3D22_01435 [Deltaproteobacteria bacterium RIFCSPHIGHO2_02_FULL_44_53]OGQ29210.1 MAG: hypothetical protein A3D98_05220 [Deltaproteobacteria bacterium RIFCSPHIGHO2_12_FULL_44_21]OGQ32767.1 MAG: hypothetical protein A2979_09365 [Deltaproteobacteria bacterium RIFCSPLOWO2_01_FULL_45_74]OGQ41869.1 MAG: hypothetical protein A3I70_09150 [Deltaproteobacteria bacterium 
MANFEPKQFGKYVLIEKLAVGGMAEIYKAKTYGAEGFEKLLAIKRILPHAAADKEFIDMLIDEAKLSVLLSHANVVQVYDLGKLGDDYFISMEFIHGVNLRDILYRLREKNKKLPIDLSVYVASEICKGLDYAHRKADSNNQPLGIVHRDISPQNVLISYEGEVKIVDFGIAKAAMNISHTMAGILKGKIAYMSPEQAMGKAIDFHTDIFSLGILVYEALTGKKLYTGESQFEVLKKIRTTRIDASKLPESILEPLKPIIAKALAYKPEDRYSSAGDMQIALTKFLYATYTDFSPRKLALFVQELFRDEMRREVSTEEKEKVLEAKTGSISLLQSPTQENIVHRETGAAALDSTRPVSVVKSITISETFSPRRKPFPWTRFLIATLLAGFSFLTWKLVLQPKKIQQEVISGTLHIVSEPPGADIFINGKTTEYKTPAILENLKTDQDHVVALALEKYGRIEKTIHLDNETPLTLSITLSKNLGVLNVISEPSGAAILVNGITTGKVTPATLDDLSLNTEYRVTVSKPEHLDFEQQVTLFNATPQKILASLKPIEKLPEPLPPVEVQPPPVEAKPPPVATIPETTPPPPIKPPLEEKPAKIQKKEPKKPVEEPKKQTEEPRPTVGGEGMVRVSSNPSGADIFINGEPQGQTPATIRVKAGSTRILVTKGDDKMPCRQVVQVRDGETASVNCSLGTLYGKIEISSTPPRASVYFNGKNLGKTPLTIQKIKRDREHTLRIELDGYRSWERSFDLEDRESKAFNVDLER